MMPSELAKRTMTTAATTTPITIGTAFIRFLFASSNDCDCIRPSDKAC